jgi:hypothetical protein
MGLTKPCFRLVFVKDDVATQVVFECVFNFYIEATCFDLGNGVFNGSIETDTIAIIAIQANQHNTFILVFHHEARVRNSSNKTDCLQTLDQLLKELPCALYQAIDGLQQQQAFIILMH